LKSFFWDFIASNNFPWITCLSEACNILAIDVVEGKASLSHVFKMKWGEETFALKIVDKTP